MPGLGRFRLAWRGLSSGLCHEPFHVCLLHVGETGHGGRRADDTAQPNLPDTYHDRLERYTLDANGVAIPGSVKIFIDLPTKPSGITAAECFFIPPMDFFTGLSATIPLATTTRSLTKVCIPVFFALMWIVAAEISATRPAPADGRFHGKLFYPKRQSFRGPVECA